ncbi:MAG: tetratricopeptide repeat protein [Bacteroidia bacterium]|nr:tetratricopeptide repeat protein [Bacteroidia bacterium]
MLKRALLLFTGILLLSQTGLMGQTDLTGALDLYAQEKYDDATDKLRGFISVDPRTKNADEIYYWLGMIKYRQEAFEQAKQSFEKAIEFKSKSPYGHAGLGLMLMIEQNYTTANAELEMADAIAKGKIPDIVFAMAEAYLKGTGPEIAKAKQLLYSYRASNPEDCRTYIMLGEYYRALGVNETAIEELEKAVQKCPDYVPAYTGLAELYYDRGKETKSGEDYQKGASMVQKALELNPNFAPAYRIRAELFMISSAPNRFDRARADIEKYLELAGDDLKAKVRYIQFLFLTEDYQLVLNEMDKIDTTTNVLRRLKGMSYSKLGQTEKAKIAMDEYFAVVKEQYQIAKDNEVYGDILRLSGDKPGADVYYQKAMSMKPEEYKDFYTTLAEDYKTQARAIEAKAKDMEAEAKTLEGTAMTAYNGANECAARGDEACRDSLKLVMDKAVEDRKSMLDDAAAIKATAEPVYADEAYYRQMAVTFADPVSLTLYKDLAVALYNAKDWTNSDEAFKQMSVIKADYMLPYTYRLRIAYEVGKTNPELPWPAKPVAEDVIAAFAGNPTGNDLSKQDLNTMLLSYELMALYTFDPEKDQADYDCAGAKTWIQKIDAIDPNYSRIQELKNYCN